MVRLMTYNVHRCVGLDGRHLPERVADVIAECDPDIVALQEVDVERKRTGHAHHPQLLAQFLKMEFHFHPCLEIAQEKFGNAVLSRLPFRVVRSAGMPTLLSWPVETRGATWICIDLGGGRRLQVINTHLGLVERERRDQVLALASRDWLGHPDCGPTRILCGDLNARPDSAVCRALRRILNPTDGTRRGTWPAICPVMRLDHVFVSDGVVVQDVSIPRSFRARIASDHLPVLVDFTLS